MLREMNWQLIIEWYWFLKYMFTGFNFLLELNSELWESGQIRLYRGSKLSKSMLKDYDPN